MSAEGGNVSSRLRAAAARWPLAAALVIGVVLGWGASALLSPAAPEAGKPAGPTTQAADQPQTVWTCSMHPQIRESAPGLCRICGMELIPLVVERASAGAPVLTLSKEAVKLLAVETAPVVRRFATAEVRMTGKVAYDETRLKYITAWVGGRLERLFVDYTGVPVRKGDHMVVLYSPELLSAQEELLQALEAVKGMAASDIGILREATQATVEAAREKLRLWGLTAEQIAEIERSGRASDRVTIYAPIGGIVVHKNAQEGMYVDVGARIYTIADLSHVWALLDAYESDLEWLRLGQTVEFTTVADPGRVYTGTISFLDPVLDAATRTVKVRVDVPNADGSLKPGMFVKGVVRAEVAAGGKVLAADLAGKWICPMHPSVVKDAPGACDICGMPLVRPESLGYVSAEGAAEPPLIIPASAALVTGKRAVVYVQTDDGEDIRFEGREVVLGPRAGDYYIVHSGLAAGELVVTRGNFMIDSALQIQAKPSMMSPEGAPPAEQDRGAAASAPARPTPPPVGAEFVSQLQPVLEGYMAVQAALAGDDLPAAAASAAEAQQALAAVDMTLLSGDAHTEWMASAGHLGGALGELAAATDIQAARKAFAALSEQMAVVAERYGPLGRQAIYRLHCPMAFDGRGADWLQLERSARNPYLGAAMPKCGEVTEVIAAGAAAGDAGEHRHE